MPWNRDVAHGGFSHTDDHTWLPIPEVHYNLAANIQLNDTESVFHFTKRFLEFRKTCEALQMGDIKFHDVPQDMIVFDRTLPDSGETVTCIFNLSENARGDEHIIINDSDEMLYSIGLEIENGKVTEFEGFGWGVVKRG